MSKFIAYNKPTAALVIDAKPASPLAEFARIPVAIALYGISRSAIYREAGDGRIILKKHGKSTLVDLASLRAFLNSLPPATIRAPRKMVAE